jgi:hypothetical protein
MWEAASGGRTRQRALWRLCRETTAVMVSRIVPAHGVFGKTHIFPRDLFARGDAASHIGRI